MKFPNSTSSGCDHGKVTFHTMLYGVPRCPSNAYSYSVLFNLEGEMVHCVVFVKRFLEFPWAGIVLGSEFRLFGFVGFDSVLQFPFPLGFLLC